MSLTPLDNPLERLGVLPNGMNWRGGWAVTEQYYLNDVVVSPSNSASYILAGKTALLGGADPTLNPDWIELSIPTTGVQSVNAGAGIALNPLGTATNPIIDNAGVITVTAGTGVSLDPLGTAQNPIINNDGIISLVQGLGMSITAGQNPTITNNGIRTLTVGTGLSSDLNPNNPTIQNTGVISAVAGAGISVAGTNPLTVTNTGIISLAAGSGIAITGGNNPATIASTSAEPVLSLINVIGSTPVAGPIPLQTTPFNDTVVFQTLAPANKFIQSIVNTPFATGGWLLDLTGFTFFVEKQNIPPPATITVSLRDGGGNEYPIPSTDGGEFNLCANSAGIQQYYTATAPQVYLDLATYRSVIPTGFVSIAFKNSTGTNLYSCSFPRVIYARYYPNGVE